MSDEKESTSRPTGMNKDEVALELARFIVSTTGYGKTATGAGFAGKAQAKTPDDQVEALIQLFERCRASVGKQS